MVDAGGDLSGPWVQLRVKVPLARDEGETVETEAAHEPLSVRLLWQG